ncbi:MAG: bactofilin family protein [Nitrospiraceae bacterium]
MWKQDKQVGKHSMSDQLDVEDNGSSSQSPRPETGEEVSAFVGKGVDFKGTITYHGTVRIDGSLEGEIHTEGILLVGEEAVITAKVTAGTIVCKGKITGEIHARDKIKLRSPAVVSGGVKTPMLSVEDGVLLNGTLEMTRGVREVHGETTLHPVSLDEEFGIQKVNV